MKIGTSTLGFDSMGMSRRATMPPSTTITISSSVVRERLNRRINEQVVQDAAPLPLAPAVGAGERAGASRT